VTNRQLSRIRLYGEIVTPAVIAGVCLLSAVLGDAGRQALRYERTALAAGQWWRIITAHFVHLNIVHTVMNVAALGLLVLLFRRELGSRDWTGAGLASACGIAAGLYLLSTDTQWYVGLSGLLHGWFAFAAARVCRRETRFGLVLLGALLAKLAYEQLAGPIPSTAALDVGPVVSAAHLYGAAAAGVYFVAGLGLRLVGGSRRQL